MEVVTGITQGGKVWFPQFVQSIDTSKCIGCGRCFRVCGRDVMRLVAVDEDGTLIEIEDEDEECEKKVMTLPHPENCIGCEACFRVCPKQCYTHGPVPAAGT
ncbi:MAG: ferredoxin III, nif-specific [Nitrospirae bacterium]|nr:ferredoxin III, nif-specific [Nitrospirota bacterium]